VSEDLSDAVRAEVNRLVAARGWSGRELARRTGIHQASLSRKLAGTSPFDLDDLPAVCAALEVDVTELLERARRR
jgi:DNA-binding Xre family transcriptional regulator